MKTWLFIALVMGLVLGYIVGANIQFQSTTMQSKCEQNVTEDDYQECVEAKEDAEDRAEEFRIKAVKYRDGWKECIENLKAVQESLR